MERMYGSLASILFAYEKVPIFGDILSPKLAHYSLHVIGIEAWSRLLLPSLPERNRTEWGSPG